MKAKKRILVLGSDGLVGSAIKKSHYFSSENLTHFSNRQEADLIELSDVQNLFNKVNPNEGGDYIKNINQNSFKVYKNAKLETSLKSPQNKVYQFERNGYFIQDSKYSKSNRLIFNRAVSLRDSWAKILANKNK